MGWPLVVGLAGYPLWWLLGLELVVWPIVALLLCLELYRHPRRLRAPRGVVLWLTFLAWTVASAAVIGDADRLAAWSYRVSHYAAALVVVVAIASMRETELPTGRLARAVLALWVAVVIGGFIGILVPDVEFDSLLALLVPAGMSLPTLVTDSLTLQFGNTAEFLGAPRPSTLFAYTNSWAAALGVITPLAVFSLRYVRSPGWRLSGWVLMVASLIPAVVSLNRGLWVSLVVAAAAGALLLAVYGHLRGLISLLAASLMVGAVVWLTPLQGIIQRRLFETPNLSTRTSLASASVDLARESPLVGFGSPVEETLLQNSNSVSVGTHGQLWTLLVSHGVIAVLLYVGFFVAVLWYTRHVGLRGVWLQVTIVVLLVQAPFYSSVPLPLILGAVAVGLLTRLSQANQISRGNTSKERNVV